MKLCILQCCCKCLVVTLDCLEKRFSNPHILSNNAQRNILFFNFQCNSATTRYSAAYSLMSTSSIRLSATNAMRCCDFRHQCDVAIFVSGELVNAFAAWLRLRRVLPHAKYHQETSKIISIYQTETVKFWPIQITANSVKCEPNSTRLTVHNQNL